MRHLIDPLDFSQEEITSLLDLADRIRSDPAAYQDVAAHKKLATLFYEPSTRTRLSFEAAMLNLGGHVLGFPSETVSSASKGESVADTIRVVSCYADIVAMRHPKEGAPFRASRYSRIPVINAGDGGHQHPTQTMTDLMTIRTRMGRLDNLTIGLCGDLTAHARGRHARDARRGKHEEVFYNIFFHGFDFFFDGFFFFSVCLCRKYKYKNDSVHHFFTSRHKNPIPPDSGRQPGDREAAGRQAKPRTGDSGGGGPVPSFTGRRPGRRTPQGGKRQDGAHRTDHAQRSAQNRRTT